jgi:LysM repeat protein
MRDKRLVVVLALAALVTTASGATYVVEAGDTLWAISRAHGTTVQEIVALNGVRNPDLIHVGQELRLPGSVDDEDRTSTEAPAGGSQPGSTTSYRVKRGDTLYAIARAHGTTVSELVRINGIANPNLIRVGQVITISGDPATPPPPAPSPPPGAMSRSDVGRLLESTARAHGLDPALVKAVAWQESRWRTGAVSPAGARGVMQVMPSTGRWISTTLAGRHLDLDDPADNILAGVLYLRYLERLTGGDEARMLASYLQGPNAVARNGISASGQRYVSSVRALMPRFG